MSKPHQRILVGVEVEKVCFLSGNLGFWLSVLVSFKEELHQHRKEVRAFREVGRIAGVFELTVFVLL